MNRRLTATDNDLLQVMSKLAPEHLYSRYIFIHLLLLARQKSQLAGPAYVLHLANQLDRLGIYDERIEQFFVNVCRGNLGCLATILDAYAADLFTAQNLYDAIEFSYQLEEKWFATVLAGLGYESVFCLRGQLTEYRQRSIVRLPAKR